MSRLRSLLRALAGRDADVPAADAHQMAARLQKQLQELSKSVAAAQHALRRTQRDAERALLLASSSGAAARRLDALEDVLVSAQVSRQLVDAIGAADERTRPVPHLVVRELFPPDVYGALVDAVPPSSFFDEGPGGELQLAVPPVVAPVDVVATWAFVSELTRQVMRRALVAAVDGRRAAPTIPTDVRRQRGPAVAGRIVRRGSGYEGSTGDAPRMDTIVVVVALAAEPVEHGLVLEHPSTREALTIALPPNTAVAWLGAGARYGYASIPSDVATPSNAHDVLELLIEVPAAGAADVRRAAYHPTRQA
jgi:hypothetical protein